MSKGELILNGLRWAFRKSSSFCKPVKPPQDKKPGPNVACTPPLGDHCSPAKPGDLCCPDKPGEGGKKGAGASPSWQLWKRISLFVAIPAVALLTAAVAAMHKEQERPPFVPYDHLRIHRNRFPWGDGKKTLFHNPHVNPLPEGYEDELENEETEAADKEEEDATAPSK